MPAPLLVADVPWLLYRSFFALPRSIKGADGKPVNALLGTVNAILAVLEASALPQSPRAVVACLGAEQAAYRVELYPPYHAHRDPMPPELSHQWAQAGELLSSLGWVVASSEDLEADDVMFSYARTEKESGGSTLVMSGDRDLYGAVDDSTEVLELGKKGAIGTLGTEQVRERYGIDPPLVPDLIALRGDPSDGLPGAPGIGAKTAAELLRAHGSLEGALAAAAGGVASSDMRPKVAEALRENAELLRTFKLIATLQRIDVERPADHVTDCARGADAARRLGMRRLAERLERLAEA
jgi:DNA polymerase-1